MISPRDLMSRVGVGGRLVPFFKCVCVYFLVAIEGGEGGAGVAPGAGAVAAKCAPVLCLLLAVALTKHDPATDQGRYAARVSWGLALSALGDALLVWPALLVWGMAAFAAAHVAYVLAFGWRPRCWALGAVCLAAVPLYVEGACGGASGLLAALVPGYAVLLATMAWRAVARGGSAAIGGLLFLVSDAILGYRLFTGPLPYGQVLVMSTYYLGQLGIAMSALRSSPPTPGGPSPRADSPQTAALASRAAAADSSRERSLR